MMKLQKPMSSTIFICVLNLITRGNAEKSWSLGGGRYGVPLCEHDRYRHSFIPPSVKLRLFRMSRKTGSWSQEAEFALLWLFRLFIYELFVYCCVWVECVVQGQDTLTLITGQHVSQYELKVTHQEAKRANHSSCLAQTLPVLTDFQNKTRTTALFTHPVGVV